MSQLSGTSAATIAKGGAVCFVLFLFGGLVTENLVLCLSAPVAVWAALTANKLCK